MRDDDFLQPQLDLGPCCACERTGPEVRNVWMLDRKAEIPGHGWGCVVCALPSDGAVAVLCDQCMLARRQPHLACRGYPAVDGRIPIEQLTESHRHRVEAHPEIAQLN